MEIPTALRDATETLVAGRGRAEIARAAQTISERYRGESGSGKRLLTGDAEAAAYAAARMPATFCAVLSALVQTLTYANAECTSLLDAGAGTGAACWAALEALPDIRQITCLEREAAMRRTGQQLALAGPEPMRNAEWLEIDLVKEPIPRKADLVIASYVLGEMVGENRFKTAAALWDTTDKLLLIIEPGTPVGYAQMKEVRTLLLSSGAHIVAPCPHEEPCPIPEGDWCHFACRVPRSRLHRALKGGEAPYEDEKFCYMAFSKEPATQAEARVLRHPQVEPGRVTLTLCTPEGIQKSVVAKRDKEVFKRARKADWGDGVDRRSEN